MLSASEAKKKATEMFATNSEAEVQTIWKNKIEPAIIAGQFETSVKDLSPGAKLLLQQHGYSVNGMAADRDGSDYYYKISWK